MYPYSEYLQKDLFKLENLNKDGDKIKDDFRLTTWGKYLRKFWIDEIPQLYNIIKGDISIDTETLGLNIKRDRLCLIQLRNETDKKVYLIKTDLISLKLLKGL